jgi:hypothetical protein
MDFVTLFAPLFGIAFLIERILESIVNVVELSPNVIAMKQSTDPAVAERYAKIKQIATMILAILLGVVVGNMLGVGFILRLDVPFQVDPAVDRLITGAIAGALAPYAHQVLEAILNFQKLMEAQKNKIESGETAEVPAEAVSPAFK